MLSRLEKDRHDTAERDNDPPGDLTIRADSRNEDALNLEGEFEYHRSHMNTILQIDTISNVTTRSQSSPMGDQAIQDTYPEACDKEP